MRDLIIENIIYNTKYEIQERVLKLFSQTLTMKKNIEVVFSKINPYVDFSSKKIIIKIPDTIVVKNNFLDWLIKKGITLHEIYHIMFSGNPQKFIDENLEKYSYYEKKIFREILNIIEDARIEFLGIKEYKGSIELITFTNLFFYKLALTEKLRIENDLLFALAFEIKGFRTNYKDRELLDEILEIAKGVFREDFEGTMRIAQKILDLLIKKNKVMKILSYNEKFKRRKKNIIDKINEMNNFSNENIKNKNTKKKIEKGDYEKIKSEIEKTLKKIDFEIEKNEKNNNIEGNDENENEEDMEENNIDDILNNIGEENEDKGIEDKIINIKISEKDFEEIFKGEKRSFEIVEKEIKKKIEDEISKMEKEIEDSSNSELDLEIPKLCEKLNFSKEKTIENSKIISQELANKIFFGKRMLKNQKSGKLNIRSATRSMVNFYIDGNFNENIYEREIIDTPEHCVLISIDCSGSMSNRNIIFNPKNNKYSHTRSRLDSAKKVVFILSHVFENLGVKFSIRGFCRYNNGEDILVKRFDEEFDYRKLAGLMSSGTTPTDKAIDIAMKKMNEMDDDLKIIFVITDGKPDDFERTKSKVLECRNKGIKIFGIFFSESIGDDDIDRFEKIFGKENFIVCKNFEMLKDGLLNLYEKVLSEVMII